MYLIESVVYEVDKSSIRMIKNFDRSEIVSKSENIVCNQTFT